jgi:hypothetical protein
MALIVFSNRSEATPYRTQLHDNNICQIKMSTICTSMPQKNDAEIIYFMVEISTK